MHPHLVRGSRPPASRQHLADLYDLPTVRDLARAARAHGWGIWVVGGAVRDALAGRISHDLDLVTTATPQENRVLLREVGGFGQVGGLSGVVRGQVPQAGGNTRSVDISPLHDHPAAVGTSSLHRDLSLRDLTVNTAALDAISGDLHDPFGAVDALAHGTLDTPLDPQVTFGLDPFRLVRVVRFEATRALVPTSRVVQYQRDHGPHLPGSLTARVYAELTKISSCGAEAMTRALHRAADRGFAHRLVPNPSNQPLDKVRIPKGADHPLHTLLTELTADLVDPRPVLRAYGVPRRLAQQILDHRTTQRHLAS